MLLTTDVEQLWESKRKGSAVCPCSLSKCIQNTDNEKKPKPWCLTSEARRRISYFLLLSLWRNTFFFVSVHHSVGQSGWRDINYSSGIKHMPLTVSTKQWDIKHSKTRFHRSSYTEAVRFLFLFLILFIFVVKNSLRFCFPSHFSPIILFASENKGSTLHNAVTMYWTKITQFLFLRFRRCRSTMDTVNYVPWDYSTSAEILSESMEGQHFTEKWQGTHLRLTHRSVTWHELESRLDSI